MEPTHALRQAADFAAALVAPPQEAQARLATMLHPAARFMALGREAGGGPAVAEELVRGPSGDLARRLQWQPPQAQGAAIRLHGRRAPGSADREIVLTLAFEGDAIALVQLQRMPAPPPPALPLKLPAALCRMVDHALEERHPMLLAYTDLEGQPVMSFRGSVRTDGEDSLALWIRNPDGAFVRAIRANPRVALVYRNEDSKATYHFQGRARVSDAPDDRRRVFDAAPQVERAHDFAMLGVPVLVALDRVEGYAGLGPAGQVDPIRMLRGAAGG